MARGRKPVARAKRAREGGSEKKGAVSHRPLPAPVVVAGRNVPVQAPDELPPRARQVWEFIVRELAEAGVIDRIDLPQLRAFCVQVADEQEFSAFLDEKPDVEETKDLDEQIQRMETIASHLEARLANQLRSGLPLDVKDIRATESYEGKLANLRAYRSARKHLGNRVAMGSMGQLVEHPMVGSRRAASSLLLRFATEFALTPTSRARLGLVILEGKSLKAELDEELGPATKR